MNCLVLQVGTEVSRVIERRVARRNLLVLHLRICSQIRCLSSTISVCHHCRRVVLRPVRAVKVRMQKLKLWRRLRIRLHGMLK